MAGEWTRPVDVRDRVAKKWPSLLADFATGRDWAPIDIPLRGPAPAEKGS